MKQNASSQQQHTKLLFAQFRRVSWKVKGGILPYASGSFSHVQSSVIRWWLGKEKRIRYMEGLPGPGLNVMRISSIRVPLARTQSHDHT